LLLIATAISVVLWWADRDGTLPYEALAILAVVLFNATLGFIQEVRAEAAVNALRAMSANEASVLRDGTRQRIPAVDLVVGDVIYIEEGDTIPADARLIESTALQTSEAALTGESIPVFKEVNAIAEDAPLAERVNMVFSGTAATYGRGRAVVTATGMRTEMGRIAGLLEETPDVATPLQQELNRVGKLLGLVVGIIAVIIVATIVVVEDVRAASTFFDVLILGVALAVAAVPEGLPAVVTAVLALGVQRMARRNAIVRHLAAVETLGSANIIASDKTGTLTRNEMTARTLVTASGRVSFTGIGYSPEGAIEPMGGRAIDPPWQTEITRALAVANRANNASIEHCDGEWIVHGDPTDGALLVAAQKAGLHTRELDTRLERVSEVPFSSERKMMSTIHREADGDERLVVFAKGAPDVLLGRCTHEMLGDGKRPLTEQRRQEIMATVDELASDALRTLAMAAHWLPDAHMIEPASAEHELVFAGLLGIIDPPRPEAAAAVRLAQVAGIRPIMITGDHPRTAAVIARELGISPDGRVLTPTELARMNEAERAHAVREVSVYARVNPEDKLRIIAALRANRAIVAMTGDGVNDAPALKSADIGIAMGITGTDVSKEAADIILADDNFATIVAAVEEGRAIFDNIRKFLRYLLSSNVGEVLAMFLGVLCASWIGLDDQGGGVLVLPLLATQILWINLVTDGPPALALGLDPPAADLMQRPPRPAGERVITVRMWRGIVLVGAIMAAGTLLVLDASLSGGIIPGAGSLAYGQTMAFTTLMLFQVFNVLNARSDLQSAFSGLFHNRWLWSAIALSVVLQIAAVYLPFMQLAFGTVSLTARDWVVCAAVSSTVLWLREADKLLARRRVEKSAQTR
ncbi:MAG TPA: cation-translocating P-type ATPase, partial [Longimicrobiales bacterium]